MPSIDKAKDKWEKGDTYGPNDSCIYTSGIHITIQKRKFGGWMPEHHFNSVECYGNTIEQAEERRNLILAAMSQLLMLEVVQ